MVVGEVNIVGEVSLSYRHVVGSDPASVFAGGKWAPLRTLIVVLCFKRKVFFFKRRTRFSVSLSLSARRDSIQSQISQIFSSTSPILEATR